MFSPEDAEINLIPFGTGVVKGQEIPWPSGERMSALGLAEALETAAPRQIGNGLEFDVVPEATFVLLKLIAYQDRPEARQHDVADIIASCERYEIDSGRRYDVSGAVVDGVEISFDVAGAFVLGQDVSAVSHTDSRAAADHFFSQVPDRYATPVTHVIREEGRTFVGDERREQVFRLFRALRAGLTS